MALRPLGGVWGGPTVLQEPYLNSTLGLSINEETGQLYCRTIPTPTRRVSVLQVSWGCC